MLSNEVLLGSVKQAYENVSPGTIDEGVRAFVGNIGNSPCPSPEEIRSAMNAARRKVSEKIFKPELIQLIVGGDVPDDRRVDSLRLEFGKFEPPLNSPPLPASTEMMPSRMPFAAMLGAILGALIGSPVCLYLLAMRDVGLLFGPPIGALLTTLALEQASRNARLSRILITTLSVATVAEAWALLSRNPLTTIWQKASVASTARRIAVYVLLVTLLVFTRRRTTYDRTILEQSARQALNDWLYGSLLVLAVLSERRNAEESTTDRGKRAMAELGKRIMHLNVATAENISGLAAEVIDAARDAGFEGLAPVNSHHISEESCVLLWAESMRARYNVFGHVEDGDSVRVEQEPVVRGGDVLEKGLVRKKRGG